MAHCIFVNNVVNTTHSLRPNILSTGVFDIPLPCSQRLWKAKTSIEWKTEMDNNDIQQRADTLSRVMESLLADGSSSVSQLVEERFLQTSFSMNILIHATAFGVIELNRSMPSASSKAIQLLKSADFKVALSRWLYCFDQMDRIEREEDLSRSALICYHLTYVLLDADINGILKAAGFHSHDDDVLALDTDTTPLPYSGGYKVYLHLLNLLQICFEESNTSPKPLHTVHTEFLTVLVFWAYAREVKHKEPQQQHSTHDNTDVTNDGRGNALYAIRDALQRENSRFNSNSPNLISMKEDLYKTALVVRDRLLKNTSEFGTFL